jgi:hypothetical protein
MISRIPSGGMKYIITWLKAFNIAMVLVTDLIKNNNNRI